MSLCGAINGKDKEEEEVKEILEDLYNHSNPICSMHDAITAGKKLNKNKCKKRTTPVKVEGHSDLDTIIAHYNALPILISFVKRHGAQAILNAWDIQRNKKSHFVIKGDSIVLDN